MMLSNLIDFLIPRKCNICRGLLQSSERLVCSACTASLPMPDAPDDSRSHVARLFWGIASVQRGGALFTYNSSSPQHLLLVRMKYGNHPDLCQHMGRLLATHFLPRGFFCGIDLLVPVPLADRRMRERHYNQSERIADGIHQLTRLPVDATNVLRIGDNPTQTHMTREQRQENVRNIFHVLHPERFRGRHILLVDDVITTGATLAELARAIQKVAPDATFSFLAVGLGGKLKQKRPAEE